MAGFTPRSGLGHDFDEAVSRAREMKVDYLDGASPQQKWQLGILVARPGRLHGRAHQSASLASDETAPEASREVNSDPN